MVKAQNPAPLISITMLCICILVARPIHATSTETACLSLSNKANCIVFNPRPKPEEQVTWTGECKNGKAHGEGTLTWRYVKNGEWKEDIYSGSMMNGKHEGFSVTHFGNGDIFEGEYHEGRIDGKGTLTLYGGMKSIGFFMKYKGSFLNGHPVSPMVKRSPSRAHSKTPNLWMSWCWIASNRLMLCS